MAIALSSALGKSIGEPPEIVQDSTWTDPAEDVLIPDEFGGCGPAPTSVRASPDLRGHNPEDRNPRLPAATCVRGYVRP